MLNICHEERKGRERRLKILGIGGYLVEQKILERF